MSCGDFSSHEIFPVVRMTPLPWKANKTKRATVALYPKIGIAFLWLKYKLNYTKARALRVTVLLGYVEITITVYSISQDMGFVNGFILYMVLQLMNIRINH